MTVLEIASGRSTAIGLVLALAIGSWLAVPAPRVRVVVTDTETTILDVVAFEPGTATLHASSLPTLDAVAATLMGNPSIELLDVQSHTGGLGDHDANLELSQRRAEVVASYLVAAGIVPSRLTANGWGDEQPIDVAAPAKNERISFVIVRRASP